MEPNHASKMAEALLAVQMERLRVEEALTARDNAVAHLEDACVSVRQKAETILQLERELEGFKRASTPANTNTSSFETPSKSPRTLRSEHGQVFGQFDGNQSKSPQSTTSREPKREPPCTPDKLGDCLQSNSAYRRHSPSVREPHTPVPPVDAESKVSLSSDSDEGIPAERTIVARQAVLASLPLPSGIPDDALQPIMIPPSHTFSEFLGNASGSLKDLLQNYRVLSQLTTYWCPDREEHGYFLAPAFKCSTNPRVTTAHRWFTVDVIGQMSKETECFYNKDGKWYYAGTYKAFRMDDLTVQEWEALSVETTQALVKETLAGRKNVSPQNHYETSQLYAAGALRVACVGLHCVGFSEDLYRGVIEQSRRVYWGRSVPFKTPTARSEASDDLKSALP